MMRSKNTKVIVWKKSLLLVILYSMTTLAYADLVPNKTAPAYGGVCDELELSVSITDVTCPGDEDGAIEVDILELPDGLSASFFWSGPEGFDEVGDNISELVGGTYNLTIELTIPPQSLVCTLDTFFVVEEVSPILIELVSQKSACDGLQDGWLEVQAQGGNEPYQYNWGDDGSGTRIEGLSAGFYTVFVTDSEGCANFMTFQVEMGSNPTIELESSDIQDVSCFNGNDGAIDPDVSEDVVSYSWSVANATEDKITNLSPGTYSLTVENADGCIAMEEFVVANAEPIDVVLEALEPIPCEEGGLGTITATVTNGAEPYSFNWSSGNSANGPVAMYGEAGDYQVVVEDANGCLASSPVPLMLGYADSPQLVNPSALTVSANVAQQIQLEADLPNATFVWSVVSVQNINVIASQYSEQGDTEFIDLTVVLEPGTTLGTIVFTVTPSAGNCVGEAQIIEVTVRVDGCPIQVAEIFTPNADNVNDEWQIEVDSRLADSYSISVFSRGGQLVFQSNTLSNRWTGEGCPDGSYFYLIEGREDGNSCEGIVSLLR